MLDTRLIPSAIPNSRRLMVVLHGLGDSMDGYEWLPAALQLPWLNYLLVNAPDPYYGGYSWFDFMGDATSGIRRSRRMIFDLLDNQQHQGFPADQILLFGFSQGGTMTLEVGLRYRQVLAGGIGISGFVVDLEELISERSAIANQQRFLVTHGRRDPLLPFAEVKRQIARLQAEGMAIVWREFDKEHTIAGDEEITVIREYIDACYRLGNRG